jgi:transposase InsO family protein
LVVLDLFTRRIIGFGIDRADIDGVSVCRMFNDAITGQPLPKRVSTDHDPLFRFHRWLANLRVLEIEEVKSVPHAPVSHPFVERLIGTIRREYLDRTFFWNAVDLQRKLDEFRDYYNAHRVHRSLDGITPANARAHHHLHPRPSINTLGGRIAEVGLRHQFRHDCEFATHNSKGPRVLGNALADLKCRG